MQRGSCQIIYEKVKPSSFKVSHSFQSPATHNNPSLPPFLTFSGSWDGLPIRRTKHVLNSLQHSLDSFHPCPFGFLLLIFCPLASTCFCPFIQSWPDGSCLLWLSSRHSLPSLLLTRHHAAHLKTVLQTHLVVLVNLFSTFTLIVEYGVCGMDLN